LFNKEVTSDPLPNRLSASLISIRFEKHSNFLHVCKGDGQNAEHAGANLLPCNAAARLQARAQGKCLP